MAMLRWWGVSSFALLPPKRSVPRVGASSPATMRSSVDFPQPEGPTTTRRSPSCNRSVTSASAVGPSGKTLSTRSSSTVAIGVESVLEEVLVGNDRKGGLHDGIRGEASLDAAVAEDVGERGGGHGLV